MAGRIPQSFIDELLSRTDIVELVAERVPLKKAGKDYTACCPFHNEKTPSFSVVPAKQFYHCFGCGVNGNALSFVMEYDRLDFPDAVEHLAGRLGMPVPREGGSSDYDQHKPLHQLMEQASQWFQGQLRQHPEARSAVDYLKGRGLTGEIAKRFELGYAPGGWTALVEALGQDEAAKRLLLNVGLAKQHESGRVYDLYRERVIFPIRDRRGRVIGFGGRVLDKSEPKYLNSPETPIFHKGREVYGLYEARQANRQLKQLIVVEGYLDVIALAQYGVNYAVATLGTATTTEHLDLLFQQVGTLIFCFDGDKAGRKAANKALDAVAEKLTDEREVRFLFLPEGEDPDTLVRQEGRAGFEARLAAAMPLKDFVAERLAAEHDCPPNRLSVQAANAVKQFAQRVPGKLHRDVLFQESRERMGLRRFEKNFGPNRRPRDEPVPRAYVPDTVERALTLLLWNPALAARLPELRGLEARDDRKLALLLRVFQLARGQGPSDTGALIAAVEGTQAQAYLQELAQRENVLKPEELAIELEHALAAIAERVREQKLMALQNKVKEQGLSALNDEEKLALRELVMARR